MSLSDLLPLLHTQIQANNFADNQIFEMVANLSITKEDSAHFLTYLETIEEYLRQHAVEMSIEQFEQAIVMWGMLYGIGLELELISEQKLLDAIRLIGTSENLEEILTICYQQTGSLHNSFWGFVVENT